MGGEEAADFLTKLIIISPTCCKYHSLLEMSVIVMYKSCFSLIGSRFVSYIHALLLVRVL